VPAGGTATLCVPQGIPTMKVLAPSSIRPPFARYAHGVEVPPGARIVMTSGQLGIGVDDVVPETALAQAVLCFANCAAILAEAGMGPADVVRINAFVTDRSHMAGYMAARDAWLTGTARLPASTLVIVAGFTRPEFLVEVEVTAAAP
jgi:enamine deaminase RidA (YjgF/YER057c/UK114 family)